MCRAVYYKLGLVSSCSLLTAIHMWRLVQHSSCPAQPSTGDCNPRSTRDATHPIKVHVDNIVDPPHSLPGWLDDHTLIQQPNLETELHDLAVELFDLRVVLLPKRAEAGLVRPYEGLDSGLGTCPYVLNLSANGERHTTCRSVRGFSRLRSADCL